MSFLSLILKNLLRQKIRAGLTLLGIGVGIMTVVALGVITAGMKTASGDIITQRGADFMVAQKGTADLSFSTLPEDVIASVAAQPGVDHAEGASMNVIRVESNPFFALFGVAPADLAAHPPPVVTGRLPAEGADDEVALGSAAANMLDASVGDTVTLAREPFTVVGIYRSDTAWENAGGYVTLVAGQRIAARPGFVSVIYVRLQPGADKERTAAQIERNVPSAVTVLDVGDYGKVDQGVRLLDAANLAISLLAVGIGAIGVMNTMVMSVFERTREIGILRAVGWSGARVLRMILTESVVLCLGAAVLGAAMGVGVAQLIVLVPAISNIIEPQYAAGIFMRAFFVAVFVAVSGAVYPAYRAVRLTPLEALRYE